MFRSTVILSDKKYNEKRSPNSNSLETSINFRKVIGANKTDDLKSFLSENKNIDPKIVEDGLISILKNKQMLLNKDFIEMLLRYEIIQNNHSHIYAFFYLISLNPDLNRTDNESKANIILNNLQNLRKKLPDLCCRKRGIRTGEKFFGS